jgi:hypothetical protein
MTFEEEMEKYEREKFEREYGVTWWKHVIKEQKKAFMKSK